MGISRQPPKGLFKILVLINIVGLAAIAILTSMAIQIAEDMAVSEADIFYIETIALIVMAIFTIFWAYMADKFNRMKVLQLCIFIWTVFCGLSVLSYRPWMLLIYQVGMFFGVAGIVPTTYSMTIDLVQKYARTESFGWLSVAQNLGAGLAFILGGFLVDFTGWRIPFLILAILGIIALPILIWKYSEPERGRMEEELCEVFDKCETYDYKISLKNFRLVLNPISNFWILISGFLSMFCTGAIGFTFVTLMQQDHGTSSSLATIFLVLMFLPQMFFPILFGKLSDKRMKQNPMIIIKILILCTFLAFLGYSIGFLIPFKFQNDALIEGTLIQVIGFSIILLLTLGISSGIPPMLFSALSYINSPETRSTVYAINNVSRTAGRGIGIGIVAFLAANFFNGYYSFPFILSTIFLLLSIVFILPLYKSYRRDSRLLQELLQQRATEILSELKE
ncbi:MAG: MFS transporter [Candidatus Helarchaeota archaeon]